MQSAGTQRKQACLGCRRRKKKCDVWIFSFHAYGFYWCGLLEKGGKPSCLLCRKWNIPCEYADRMRNRRVPSVDRMQTSNGINLRDIDPGRQPWNLGPNTVFFPRPQHPDVPEALSYPETASPGPYNVDTWDALLSSSDARYTGIGPVDGDLNNGVTAAEAIFSSMANNNPEFGDLGQLQQPHTTSGAQLPPIPKLFELARIFFDKYSHLLPCIHEGSFLDMITTACYEDLLQSSLVYAVIAIAAKGHPDPMIRECQTIWFTRSNEIWATLENDPSVSLQTLQAGCCLTFLSYIAGDYTLSFFSLGKTWRLACSMRLNLLDASPALFQRNDVRKVRADSRQRDECQRILWTVFILDRGLSFPCAMPYAINDRQFIVNLPRTSRYNKPMDVSYMSMTLYPGPKPVAVLIFDRRMTLYNLSRLLEIFRSCYALPQRTLVWLPFSVISCRRTWSSDELQNTFRP